jgi:antitoxin YefM
MNCCYRPLTKDRHPLRLVQSHAASGADQSSGNAARICLPSTLQAIPSAQPVTAWAYPLLAETMVTIILVMSETLPLADVKARLSEIVDRVEHEHERIIVTRHGRPVAVLVSPEELESLDDTLELLSDPHAVAQINQARQELHAGEVLTADELRAKYLQR